MPFTLQPQGQIVRQRRRGLRRLRSRGKGCFNVAREEDRGSRRSCCYSARLGKFGSKDLLVELLWVKVLPSLYTSLDFLVVSRQRNSQSLPFLPKLWEQFIRYKNLIKAPSVCIIRWGLQGFFFLDF